MSHYQVATDRLSDRLLTPRSSVYPMMEAIGISLHDEPSKHRGGPFGPMMARLRNCKRRFRKLNVRQKRPKRVLAGRGVLGENGVFLTRSWPIGSIVDAGLAGLLRVRVRQANGKTGRPAAPDKPPSTGSTRCVLPCSD